MDSQYQKCHGRDYYYSIMPAKTRLENINAVLIDFNQYFPINFKIEKKGERRALIS